jgi:hypothetical protein
MLKYMYFFTIIFIIGIMLYLVFTKIETHLLLSTISKGADSEYLFGFNSGLRPSQAAWIRIVPKLIYKHKRVVQTTYIYEVNGEKIIDINLYNKRIYLWNGLLQARYNIDDNKVIRELDFYIEHHISSDYARGDEIDNYIHSLPNGYFPPEK